MDDLNHTELARIAHYFAGELSPDEASIVAAEIEQRSDLYEFARMLSRSRLDFSIGAAAHIPDLESHLSILTASVSATIATDRRQNKSASIRSLTERSGSWPVARSGSAAHPWRRYTGYTIGAFIASLILVFMGWQISELRYGSLSVTSMSTYTTGNGERATVTLPDGSSVSLNVGSKLQVPSNFASGNRTVTLSGQAFFSVVAQSEAPFTVISGPSITRVLGTTFSVRHYEKDTAATVLVRDGKVSVGATTLIGGQQVSVSPYGTSPVRSADISGFSFTKGVLILDGISLVDAIPELNRWYDAEIRLGDMAFVNKEISGGFEAGSISDLMKILELMYDARVVRDGRYLTLYRGE